VQIESPLILKKKESLIGQTAQQVKGSNQQHCDFSIKIFFFKVHKYLEVTSDLISVGWGGGGGGGGGVGDWGGGVGGFFFGNFSSNQFR